MKTVAIVMIGGGVFMLAWLIVSRLSADALAMAVGLGFGAVAFVPAFLTMQGAARRSGRTALLLDEDRDVYYLEDYVTVDLVPQKQLTAKENHHGR